MIELIGLAQLAWHLLLVLAAFAAAVAAILFATRAWLAVEDHLEARRWAIRDRDDARRERELLDHLAPAPPADPITTGHDRLTDALHTPTPDELAARFPDAPTWPTEEDR